MSFRELNEAAFYEKTKSPAAREVFKEKVIRDSFETVDTASGFPTARYKRIFLHSRQDPVREADRLIGQELSGKKPDAIIMYGFALGYHAERILLHAPNADVYILEPDLVLFRNALEVRDLRPVLLSPRTTFIIGNTPEEVASILEPALDGEHLIFRIRSVYEKDRGYYEKTDAALSNLLRRKEINRNTLRRFGRLWVRNLVGNIPLISRTPGINRTAGVFRGFPVCVAAAGPSLDEIIPHLPDIRKRTVIVAVDTSLRACLRTGTDPDFTVVVDPQYWNTRHLDWTGESDGILISETSTHPRIFRKRFGSRLFCSSIFPMGGYLEARIGGRGKLGAGGSVATSAWDFARFIGGSPIFMAGLDLGFPRLETHFKGSFFEHRTHVQATRLLPGETSSYLALHDAGPFRVESNGGGSVLTDNRLIVYKQWFESQMKTHPECTTVNLSSGGVKIEGMVPGTVEELLALPEIRDRIDLEMGEILMETRNDLPGEEELEKAKISLIGELKALADLSVRGRKASVELRERFFSGEPVDPILRQLSEIDDRILSFPAKDVAGFLLSGTKDDTLEKESTIKELPVLEKSENLYRELHESITYHLSLLEQGK